MKSLSQHINESIQEVNEAIQDIRKTLAETSATAKVTKDDLLDFFEKLNNLKTVEEIEKLYTASLNGMFKKLFYEIVGLSKKDFAQANTLGMIDISSSKLTISHLFPIYKKLEKLKSTGATSVSDGNFGEIPINVNIQDIKTELDTTSSWYNGSALAYEEIAACFMKIGRLRIADKQYASKYTLNWYDGSAERKRFNLDYKGISSRSYAFDGWFVNGVGLISKHDTVNVQKHKLAD